MGTFVSEFVSKLSQNERLLRMHMPPSCGTVRNQVTPEPLTEWYTLRNRLATVLKEPAAVIILAVGAQPRTFTLRHPQKNTGWSKILSPARLTAIYSALHIVAPFIGGQSVPPSTSTS